MSVASLLRLNPCRFQPATVNPKKMMAARIKCTLLTTTKFLLFYVVVLLLFCAYLGSFRWHLFQPVPWIGLGLLLLGAILPFKYQLYRESEIVFVHFPWKKQIVIHLKDPFDTPKLRKVVVDILRHVEELSGCGYKEFYLSSPVIFKLDESVREVPVRRLVSRLERLGASVVWEVILTPRFTQVVFFYEYLVRLKKLPDKVQYKKSIEIKSSF